MYVLLDLYLRGENVFTVPSLLTITYHYAVLTYQRSHTRFCLLYKDGHRRY